MPEAIPQKPTDRTIFQNAWVVEDIGWQLRWKAWKTSLSFEGFETGLIPTRMLMPSNEYVVQILLSTRIVNRGQYKFGTAT